MEHGAETPPSRPGEAAAGRSVFRKASDAVAAHSAGALVLIVVLVVALFYLYLRQTAWFGGRFPARGEKRGRDDNEEDPEADRLIDSINSALRPGGR